MRQQSFCGICVAIVVCNTAAFTFGQLSIGSTGGSIAANLEFAGTITYDLAAVDGPFAMVSGHNFSTIQGSAGPGSITFDYVNTGTYDFTTATGFGTGGFRIALDYTNNSGEALESLQFGLSGSGAYFTGLNGIPARGNATNPAGPNPSFTGIASAQVSNGDSITYSATNVGWTFATPLGNGGTYSFFLPIEVPVTQGGGTPSGDPFTLAITPTAVSAPGDFNGDGWTDGLDYLIWAGNFGTHPGPDGDVSDGDANDDGWIDGLDYLIWAGNFGNHTASTAVPEPGTLALAALAVAGLLVSRRRR